MSVARASAVRPNDGADFVRGEAVVSPPRSVGSALRVAVRDFYHQSWRLVVLNTALSLLVVAIFVAALAVPLALVLLVLVGPAAAAMMHCAVVLSQTEDLRLGEAVAGLRLHWRRGLALGALLAGVIALGVVALAFYGGAGPVAWPLAAVVTYVLAFAGLLQLALWPLAVFEPVMPLRELVRQALLAVLRRPLAFAGLGFALLVVNVLGTAAALLPFMTLTIAYSFLAAAHFALPRSTLREVRG